MAISVCMATHNGEKFIKEQMISILNQLSSDDEVIVVDDFSGDSTVQVIRNFDDSRIKIFLNNQNEGHVYSFNRSISLANNDFVFMSDQDDIWSPNRVQMMVKKLYDTDISLISSYFGCIDIMGNEISNLKAPLKENDSRKHLKNIIGIFAGGKNYYGCAMVFRKDFTKIILPIPQFVESHDLWIALAGNLICSNIHIEEKTLMKRIHENNVSNIKRGLIPKLWSRSIFLFSILVILYRHYLNKLK